MPAKWDSAEVLMLTLEPYEIKSYIQGKGLKTRLRGRKVEMELCPFCGGGESKDKFTFVVYTDGGNFKCMRGSCATAGTFWALTEKFGDNPKDFYQSDRSYRKPQTTQAAEIVSQVRTDYSNFHTEKFEPHPITKQAKDYLTLRGFSDAAIDGVKISCDQKGNIAFLYFDTKDELCLVKLRKAGKAQKGEPKAWQAWKNGLRTLWGIEDINPEVKSIIITFGEYDRIAVVQAKFENVVSVPCGDSDLAWIDICYDDLKQFDEIYLWIDNDESGHKHLPLIANRLGKEKIKVVDVPYKDANEMLFTIKKEKGEQAAKDAIFEAVAKAKWYWQGDLIQVADIDDSMPELEGSLTGFDFLDNTLGGFRNGELTLHIGDSGHGKSTAITQITAAGLAQNEAWAVWSGEDEPRMYKYRTSLHIAGITGLKSRVSDKTGKKYYYVLPEFQSKVNDFIRDQLFLFTRKHKINEDILIEVFDLAYRRFGCTRFVVDNLMKLIAGKSAGDKLERQRDITNALSDFSKEIGVHVHLIAHIKKPNSPFEPPNKDMASGSKEITDLADNVIAWWRIPPQVKQEFGNFDTLSVILKHRMSGELGQDGTYFDERCKRFAKDSVQTGWSYFND